MNLPEWYMPPQSIGGHVTGPVLIGRSTGCLVAVRHVLAYPNGVEIEIEAHTRGLAPVETPRETDRPHGLHRPHRPQPDFRIRFSDGREADLNEETGLHSGLGPTLMASKSEFSNGGPDNHEHVRTTLWTWPLPPPGPLTLTCAWPERGFPEFNLELSGDEVVVAAERARPYWPDAE